MPSSSSFEIPLGKFFCWLVLVVTIFIYLNEIVLLFRMGEQSVYDVFHEPNALFEQINLCFKDNNMGSVIRTNFSVSMKSIIISVGKSQAMSLPGYGRTPLKVLAPFHSCFQT
ncbi:hypothetical protein RHMOL_Rhmol03G0199000 [Rhododendron molle]|uniref:Uncharacterized protein n=1 Tax=Rhododendron molle TaxID=49168 RepID=A0ACC0PG70_RHOML|nr:hypothetical protein RHMOL_Rhmol03G0199000 [Rhododendron molle]